MRLTVPAAVAVIALCGASAADARERRVLRTAIASVPNSDVAPTADARTGIRPAPRAFGSSSAPMLAVVSLGAQKLSLYSGGTLVAQSPISSGQSGHATPTGVFSIIQKNKWHTSNIYSGAEMPFMQRITWSGIALHAGQLPGYPASHGCIRLPYAFAERLWGMTKLGARVIVAPQDAQVGAIDHPGLPAPMFVREDTLGQAFSNGTTAVAGATSRLLGPLERAHAEKALASVALAKASAEARAALEAARATSAETQATVAMIRRAEAAVDAANSRLQQAARAAVEAQTPEANAGAHAEEEAAETELDRALYDLDDVKKAAKVLDAEAFELARAARDAELAQQKAERANQMAQRGVEPVSVFISRKERKLFVRQGFEPIYESDVNFRDDLGPLGTHVYVAVGQRDGAAGLNWIAVNVPGGAAHIEAVERRGRLAAFGPFMKATRTSGGAGAASVFDRFEIPEDAMAFIAKRMWVGATIIVSDHGLSHETGKGTDFVVLTP